MSLLAELKRRNVIRMGGLYLVGAWLLTQVASTVLPAFDVPAWALRALIIVLVIGFVPTLIFSWIYELTPEGIKRDADVNPGESERATILDPGDPNAIFWRGLALVDAGYLADGIAMIDRSLKIDPLLPNALFWRAFCDFNTGDLESARRRSQLAIDQGLVNAVRNLALISHAEGRDADAVAQFARGAQGSLAGFPENAGIILAEGIFGTAQQRSEAIAMIDTYLAGHTKKVSHAAPWALLLLGEPARALAVAQDPKTDNDTLFMFWLWSAQGAAARKLPQFPEFVRKMGLGELWDQRGPPSGCRRVGNGDYVCDY